MSNELVTYRSQKGAPHRAEAAGARLWDVRDVPAGIPLNSGRALEAPQRIVLVRGREQAYAAARALASEPITGIYSSPLKRARHTAEPIAEVLGLPGATPAERRAAIEEFLDYARSKPEVRITSARTVLDWMRNPRSN